MELGDLIPQFSLPSIRGGNIASWDFKQKKNLLIVFFAFTDDDIPLLQAIAQGYLRIKTFNTEVLGIIIGKFSEAERIFEEWKIPFSILIDVEEEVSLAYQVQGSFPSVIVTDRFGTLYFQKKGVRGEDIPLLLKEVESTLSFIESQCPECSI
jgi:peroxiredoxin